MTELLLLVVGAIATKLTEYVFEHIKSRRRAGRSLEVVDMDVVVQWGWSSEKLLQHLIKLDHKLLGTVLTEEREGTAEQWAPIFERNPLSWLLLASSPRNIAGYWVFVSLPDDEFDRARMGRLMDSEIAAETTEQIDIPGVYNLYFVLLGALPEFPSAGARLIDAFFTRLEELASRGVFLGGHPKPAINRHLKTGHSLRP